MYAYLAKGMTVGHLLSRRILRTLTGIPGRAIDAIVAIFWLPNYFSYWEECHKNFNYIDGTPVGFFEGATGYVGEFAGYLVGVPVGGAIGLAFAAVDAIGWLYSTAQRKMVSACSSLGELILTASAFENFCLAKQPSSYIDKSGNIGSAMIGGLFNIIPYLCTKTLEFFFPALGNNLSAYSTYIFSFLGGAGGVVISFPLYPLIHFAERFTELYELAHEKIRKGVAVIYAKANEDPIERDECLPASVVHSATFRDEVRAAKASTWEQLLLGPLKAQEQPVQANGNSGAEGAPNYHPSPLHTPNVPGGPRELPPASAPLVYGVPS